MHMSRNSALKRDLLLVSIRVNASYAISIREISLRYFVSGVAAAIVEVAAFWYFP